MFVSHSIRRPASSSSLSSSCWWRHHQILLMRRDAGGKYTKPTGSTVRPSGGCCTLDTTVRRPPLFYCDEARTAVTHGYRRTHRRPPESVAVIRQETPVICVHCRERRRCVSGSPSASPFFAYDTLQITTECDVCSMMVRFPCHTNCLITYFFYHFYVKKNFCRLISALSLINNKFYTLYLQKTKFSLMCTIKLLNLNQNQNKLKPENFRMFCR